jgi:mannose-6-phosphate isomerase-like protein (cupin superfamily)
VNDARWDVAHLSEIEPVGEPDPGEQEWRPVRHRLGIGAFGVNAWVSRNAGDFVIEDHTETEHEELYLVLSGRATFTVDGETVDAPAGTFVHLPDPKVRRKAIGEEAGTTVLAIGATRGKPFVVSRWERSWLAKVSA